MTLFLKILVRNYSPESGKAYWPGQLSLVEISNNWEDITGKPDSSNWLSKLSRRARAANWTTPFRLVRSMRLEDVAQLKKGGKFKTITDVFMDVNDQEEKKALAKFLVDKKIDRETLETLFSPDVLPLDQNEEPAPEPAPEPARERDFDLNQMPFDLSQTPSPELDEAGDDGGE